MATPDTTQAALVASKKTSSLEPFNADVELMRLTLHRANVPIEGLTDDQVRQAYAERRVQADASAAERAAQRQRDFVQRVRDAQDDAARAALDRHGIDPIGMPIETVRKYSEELARQDEEPQREALRLRQAEQRRRQEEALFNAAGCPEHHVKNLDTLDDNPRWRAVRDKLADRMKYADPFLYGLVGISGPGKTQIGVSVIHKACSMLLSARYIKGFNLFQNFRRSFTQRGKGEAGEREEDILAAFIAVDVLVIDEMHQRGETTYEQNALPNLLDLRYDARKGTIIIANQTREQFAASMGSSVISRIHECGEVIETNWMSYRKPGSGSQHSQELRQPSRASGRAR